ncbi:MAG: archaetidylserine decarboxylase [Thiotrichales bacterium]
MSKAPSLIDRLIAGVFYVLPHHAISRVTLALSRSESRWLSQTLIRFIAKQFKVDMNEALESNLANFASLNAFFTRALKPGARPLAANEAALLCPADGALSEFGQIDRGRLLQAKGYYYDAVRLLGGRGELALPFYDGAFATVYLSPRDYHRVHMPCDGRLTHMIYVPGRLFSVSPRTTRTTPEIFTRNERVIALFDTAYGRMAMVLVGAINVSAIETVWAGLVTPPPGKGVRLEAYDPPVVLKRGAEMGRFNLGSTVVLLTERGDLAWAEDLALGLPVRLGRALALPATEA